MRNPRYRSIDHLTSSVLTANRTESAVDVVDVADAVGYGVGADDSAATSGTETVR